MTRLVPVALVLLALAAGCIQPSNPADPSSPPPATHNSGGNMTASAQTANQSCTGNGGSGSAYCAGRRVSVAGDLSGVDKMDVDLKSFNGHVHVRQGAAGSWSLVADIKAYGASQDEANANLDHVIYDWRHTDGSSHFVQAEAKKDGNDCCKDAQADLDVTLPPGITLVVTLATTNGEVSVDGKTDGLSVETVNGPLNVHADVTQVSLQTVNGQIQASLRPTASGRISATTVNGQVSLSLPEDAQHGYDVTGKTTNGQVSISLRDGDLGPCPQGSQYYTPPCNERSFKTHGYDQRAIQTMVTAQATNGQVAVGPA
ncbi:MAG: hypothetical protein QOE90_2082 [Thermoplasmata archaeon]|jgi:hypothetical protein|nr:hypothetical protein [Thermoplasmata archaeon]